MKFTIENTIGFIILFYAIYYSISAIMSYYGVSSDEYSLYFAFYLFLFISMFILPNKYSSPTTV